MVADLNTLLTDQAVGPNNTIQAEAMRKLLNATLLAGATGVGLRTLRGVGDFLGRNAGEPPQVPLRRTTLPLPVPLPARRRKQAQLSSSPPAPTAPATPHLLPAAEFSKDPLTWAAQHATHALGLMREPGNTARSLMHNAISGWDKRDFPDKGWYIPAGAAAIGGGLYGGYKLTDWLLDKTRRREVDDELEQAKRDYETAMLGQYGRKAAAADPVDALYETAIEKRAILGTLAGLSMLGLGTVGLGSGLAAYKWRRDRSPTKALEEAIRRRQEALFAQAPRPIMAVPVAQGTLPLEEDDEKAASVAQAADQILRRFQARKQQAAQQWQLMINGPPKNSGKEESREPQPPQLPSLAGLYTRSSGPSA